MKNWLLIMLSCLVSNFFSLQAAMLDRVLLRVERNGFSQREMETYFLVQAYQTQNLKLIVREETWLERLAAFKNDMLIWVENRVLTIQSTHDDVEKKILQELCSTAPYDAECQRLAIDTQDLNRALERRRLVEEYKRSEALIWRQMTLKPLESKYYVRFYAGSKTYQRLQCTEALSLLPPRSLP
jgi:hypothetical protein